MFKRVKDFINGCKENNYCEFDFRTLNLDTICQYKNDLNVIPYDDDSLHIWWITPFQGKRYKYNHKYAGRILYGDEIERVPLRLKEQKLLEVVVYKINISKAPLVTKNFIHEYVEQRFKNWADNIVFFGDKNNQLYYSTLNVSSEIEKIYYELNEIFKDGGIYIDSNTIDDVTDYLNNLCYRIDECLERTFELANETAQYEQDLVKAEIALSNETNKSKKKMYIKNLKKIISDDYI